MKKRRMLISRFVAIVVTGNIAITFKLGLIDGQAPYVLAMVVNMMLLAMQWTTISQEEK